MRGDRNLKKTFEIRFVNPFDLAAQREKYNETAKNHKILV